MEFWGVEVKAGQPLKVEPQEDCLIHLSQAALGESKKDKGEPIMIFAKVADQKIVLGTLSFDKFPQMSFDVVFEKEFELSHNSKNGSVHFCGYQSQVPGDDVDEYPSDSSEDNDIPLRKADSVDAKVEIPKPAAANAKPKGNVEPPKASKEETNESDESDDEDESGDDDDDEEDGTSDSDGSESMSEDDEDADSESEDEETPKKVESVKKRPASDSAIETPAPSKKQKTATPTDGKKNIHTATPHPAKKPAANGSKQTPKSGGQFSCKSCDRSFVSDFALQSHSKAKHDK